MLLHRPPGTSSRNMHLSAWGVKVCTVSCMVLRVPALTVKTKALAYEASAASLQLAACTDYSPAGSEISGCRLSETYFDGMRHESVLRMRHEHGKSESQRLFTISGTSWGHKSRAPSELTSTSRSRYLVRGWGKGAANTNGQGHPIPGLATAKAAGFCPVSLSGRSDLLFAKTLRDEAPFVRCSGSR